MTARMTIEEFCSDPIRQLVRAEQGETVEVTRHGKVIAELIPARRTMSRYEELVADGAILLEMREVER